MSGRFGNGSNSNGQFWYGSTTNFPGFLYKKNVGVGGRRSTKFAAGGNITCNKSTYLYNKYKPGTGGVGASSIANRRAKNRHATICAPQNCFPCYMTLGQYNNFLYNPNGFYNCVNNSSKSITNNANNNNNNNNNINNVSNSINFLRYSLLRGPYGNKSFPGIDSNFGWDSNGVWFTGDANNDQQNGSISYPIFTNFTIPKDKMVQIYVDFYYNQEYADFGICLYKDGDLPHWNWRSDTSRIAFQYNGKKPYIYGLYSNVNSDSDILTEINQKYTIYVNYDPDPAVGGYITMSTIKDGEIIDKIYTNDTAEYLDGDYRIGFCADPEMNYKTYMSNLRIKIGSGQDEVVYSHPLTGNFTILSEYSI